MRVLKVVASLTGLARAVAVVPRQAAGSQVIATSTVTSTLTNTITSAYPVTTVQTSCSVNSGLPATQTNCVDGYVYSSGSFYFSEQCAVTQTGGTLIRAYLDQPLSVCALACSNLNAVSIAASSCNGFVVKTLIPSVEIECWVYNGAVTNIPASSTVWAVQAYTTNPCVFTTVTTLTTVLYTTAMSTYEIEYTSTITPSSSLGSSSSTSSDTHSTTPSTSTTIASSTISSSSSASSDTSSTTPSSSTIILSSTISSSSNPYSTSSIVFSSSTDYSSSTSSYISFTTSSTTPTTTPQITTSSSSSSRRGKCRPVSQTMWP
ncbi:hypothetical protein BX600DRAFT_540877 [Xylariales sp. PMI_506]|nr:hypothetical protein BX600DRAFT_540877 [Xylariales sp. PMI_506]